MIGQIGPLKKAIVDLPIRLKANSKRISGNSVISGGPLGAQNKDFGDPSQTLLNGVKLRLPRRLGNPRQSVDSGFHAMDSGFQVLNFSLCEGELRFWIPIICEIPDSWAVFRIPKPRIPDFTSKIVSESGFNKQEYLPDFGLPYMERLGNVVRRLYYRAYMSEFAQTFIWFQSRFKD